MKSNNNAVVPEAREALDKFKMEAAAEVGVPIPNNHIKEYESAPPGLR